MPPSGLTTSPLRAAFMTNTNTSGTGNNHFVGGDRSYAKGTLHLVPESPGLDQRFRSPHIVTVAAQCSLPLRLRQKRCVTCLHSVNAERIRASYFSPSGFKRNIQYVLSPTTESSWLLCTQAGHAAARGLGTHKTCCNCAPQTQ